MTTELLRARVPLKVTAGYLRKWSLVSAAIGRTETGGWSILALYSGCQEPEEILPPKRIAWLVVGVAHTHDGWWWVVDR